MIEKLHQLFNEQPRFHFPFEGSKQLMPKNGIYLLFEKGERFNGHDRIVRVGTHTGNNQLHSRLKQHFVKENKNRSIFRKNIGRCFLNRDHHPYLSLWELDITSKEERERNLRLLDLDFERQLEKRISHYIQTNFSFCLLEVGSKEERLFWERKIVSTIAKAQIKPSSEWLGNYSPKEKIRQCGLWQVNELFSDPLSNSELTDLQNLVKNKIAI